MKIGLQVEAARIVRGVGGRAFPRDYNWECRECGRENRSYQPSCCYCYHKARSNGDGAAIFAMEVAIRVA